jgi:hypothetical protein
VVIIVIVVILLVWICRRSGAATSPSVLAAAAAVAAAACPRDLFHSLSGIVGVDRLRWGLLRSSPIGQAGKAIVVGALKDCFHVTALGLQVGILADREHVQLLEGLIKLLQRAVQVDFFLVQLAADERHSALNLLQDIGDVGLVVAVHVRTKWNSIQGPTVVLLLLIAFHLVDAITLSQEAGLFVGSVLASRFLLRTLWRTLGESWLSLCTCVATPNTGVTIATSAIHGSLLCAARRELFVCFHQPRN